MVYHRMWGGSLVYCVVLQRFVQKETIIQLMLSIFF